MQDRLILLAMSVLLLFTIPSVHADGINIIDLFNDSIEVTKEVILDFDIYDVEDIFKKSQNGDEINKEDVDAMFSFIKNSPDIIPDFIADDSEKRGFVENMFKTKFEEEKKAILDVENLDQDEATETIYQFGNLGFQLYLTRENFHACDTLTSDEKLDNLLDSSPTLDEFSNNISLREHMDLTKNVPEIDAACDTYDFMIMAYQDDEFIYKIPLIPDEGNLVPIDVYCVKELDEKTCELLKKIGVSAQMMAKKDPNALREGTKAVLILVKTINQETNGGQDENLEIIESWLDLTYYDMIEIEFIELHNGEMKSLNQITSIECNDEFHPLQSTIEHLDSKKSKLELIQEDVNWIKSNEDAIKNNQCNVYLSQIQ